MGKGTDKLYITHSEWSSGDQFSASAGSGTRQYNASHTPFKRLPFNYCALSLQPFNTPVCTPDGQIFDHENIVRWLLKHDTNPTNGMSLKQSDLIKLVFSRSDGGDFMDPVTFKPFTENTHIVAIRHGGSANVFAFDTVDRLNIKSKTWLDLVSDEAFSRKDIITLQDPRNLASRDLNSFNHLKDADDVGFVKEAASIDPLVTGDNSKIIRAKEAVAKARMERVAGNPKQVPARSTKPYNKQPEQRPKNTTPYNASHHTTGLAAASFTSTGVTPHTSASLALLSDEEYLLKPKRVKQKGYARLSTTLGDMTIELYPEHAPKAVWNFVRLAQKKYYNGIKFHRNVKNFMLQGGDPSGTGKGGQSVWGKNFEDEFDGPLKHDTRGILSMANKGKDTNSSQFFILYREAKHLNRKHTIFGLVVEGLDILKALESAETDANNRPKDDLFIEELTVLVDPFEEYLKTKQEEERQRQEGPKVGGAGDDQTTWTGKRIRRDDAGDDNGISVGKYIKAQIIDHVETEGVEHVDEQLETGPAKKKVRSAGGFGNFDGW